jgi:hypothetical protein
MIGRLIGFSKWLFPVQNCPTCSLPLPSHAFFFRKGLRNLTTIARNLIANPVSNLDSKIVNRWYLGETHAQGFCPCYKGLRTDYEFKC